VKRVRRGLTGLAPVVIAAALAAGAASALAHSKVIGHGVRLKGTRLWYAEATAVSPKAISASLDPLPPQPVKVQWSVLCQRPNSVDPAVHLAADERSGRTSVRAPAVVKLALPYATPPTCVVTVYATLATRDRLVLSLSQS
jgi:hypothetical protein